ncbi:hypothetical protein [Marinibacterium sp. SX1]|uniref:hypothetical protein n=1 Tax=Marinibacterium sp. SX1 TaxID=3388424 RepID=UPI003D164E5D
MGKFLAATGRRPGPGSAAGLGLGVVTGLMMGLMMAPTGAEARSMADTLRRTGLTQQDISIMTAAAAPLYREGTPKVGAESEWSNPDSGASGKSLLVSFADGCADIRHVVITQRRPEPQDFVFRNCKTADGSWVLTP